MSSNLFFDDTFSNRKQETKPNQQNQPNQPEEGDEQEYRIWINEDYYIPVNAEGECIGTCFEGALGYVIKIISRNEETRFALKIPKLHGDTERENFYISNLMEKESDAVRRIIGGQNSTQGLLNAQTLMENILRKPIKLSIEHERYDLNESQLFVKYQKGKKPIFCLVKIQHEEQEEQGIEIKYYPPRSYCPIKNRNIAEQFQENFNQIKNQFQETIIVDVIEDNNNSDTNIRLSRIRDLREVTENRWYTCIPSVIYDWKPGTLQEVISRRQRQNRWSLQEHLDLISTLCQGLRLLHERNRLHTDLRPANVVYGDMENPRDYELSDYGSLAENSNPTEDGIIIGPVILGERSSPFYAPERQSGRELESANAVVIKYNQDSDYLYMIIGWRDDLIDSQTNQVKIQEIERIIQAAYNQNDVNLGNSDNNQENLRAGDRIQIKNYIFELKSHEKNIENKKVLKCNSVFWQIYHNKITIKANPSKEFQSEYQYFSISRTVELLQWSVATDIYGLGALALYSVYGDYESNDPNYNIDETFKEMISSLNSIPYFQKIWPELESLRINLEDALESDEQNLADIPYHNYTLTSPQEETKTNNINPNSENQSDKQKKEGTLKEATERISSLIIQTVPGTINLLTAIDNHLGHFIFFIHFIFCCLHRKENLEIQNREGELPFCTRRDEQTNENNENNAAKKASDRITQLIKIINRDALNNFQVILNDTEQSPMQHEPVIRLEYQKLKSQLQEKKEELIVRSDQLQERERELNEARNELQQKEEELENIQQEYNLLNERYEESKNTENQIIDYLDSINILQSLQTPFYQIKNKLKSILNQSEIDL